MHACMYVCMYVCMYIFEFAVDRVVPSDRTVHVEKIIVQVVICMYIYIYIYMHTDTCIYKDIFTRPCKGTVG